MQVSMERWAKIKGYPSYEVSTNGSVRRILKDGKVKYLKACGVDAKKFKKYITVTEEVQDEKIDNLYEVGEITKEDITDCYTVECGEPYITLRELNEQ